MAGKSKKGANAAPGNGPDTTGLNLEVFAAIVVAGAQGMFAPVADTEVAAKLGFVERDLSNHNPADATQVAVRATEAGAKWAANNIVDDGKGGSTTAATVSAAPADLGITLLAGDAAGGAIMLPSISRGGAGVRTERYPFSKLSDLTPEQKEGKAPLPQFHIKKTDARPNPAKSFASTITSANKRLKPKHFILRKVGATDPLGEGVRVFRDV